MLLEVPPVIVSPGVNVPFTFEQTTTPCKIFPAEVNDVIFVGVVPSASNNSNVFEPVTFLIVNTSLVVIAVELF